MLKLLCLVEFQAAFGIVIISKQAEVWDLRSTCVLNKEPSEMRYVHFCYEQKSLLVMIRDALISIQQLLIGTKISFQYSTPKTGGYHNTDTSWIEMFMTI